MANLLRPWDVKQYRTERGQFAGGYRSYMGIGEENFLRGSVEGLNEAQSFDTREFVRGLRLLQKAIKDHRADSGVLQWLLYEIQQEAKKIAPKEAIHPWKRYPAGHLTDNIEIVYWYDEDGINGAVTVDLALVPYAGVMHETMYGHPEGSKQGETWKYIEKPLHNIGRVMPKKMVAEYQQVFEKALMGRTLWHTRRLLKSL